MGLKARTTPGNCEAAEGQISTPDDDRFWVRAGDGVLTPEALDLLPDDLREQYGAEAEEDALAMRFVQERMGFSASGVPLNSSPLGQLHGEDRGWRSFGDQEFAPYDNRRMVHDFVTERYNREGVSRNIITAYTFFTYGNGFRVRFPSEARQSEYDTWAREQKMNRALRKVVRETYLYGSVPVMLFPLTWSKATADGHLQALRNNRTDRLMRRRRKRVRPARTFRVMPESRLVGIHTDPEDHASVLAYEFASTGGSTVLVAPEDVVLSSLGGLGTDVRGGSILAPAMPDILRLERRARSQFYVDEIRSRMPAIRSHKGPKSSDGRGAAMKKLPPPGSVVEEWAGTTWQFPQLNLDSAGSGSSWRLHVLRVAAAVSLPEYLVLQDASNSNYASTLVASGPVHNMFLSYQEDRADFLEELLSALGWDGFEVEVPDIVPQDRSAHAESLRKLVRERIISRQTAAEELQYDPDHEARMILADPLRPDQQLFPDDPPDDDEDDEDEPPDNAE